jgi:hypothetical protein
MIERNISVAEVRVVLENGELIEEYKADSPPRYLLDGAELDRFMWSEKMTP